MSNFDIFMQLQKLVWDGEPDFDKANALVRWLAEANALMSSKDMSAQEKSEFHKHAVDKVARMLDGLDGSR